MRRFLLGFVAGVLVLPTLALATAWLGRFPTKAQAAPSGWESAFARWALNTSIQRNAPQLSNPLPATDENLLAGMKIFRDACDGCHGDPNGTSGYGASFYPHVPQFASYPPRRPDWQLFWIIKYGVRYSGMSAWDGQWPNGVSDDRMWKVAMFLSRLDSLPPAVSSEWHKKQQ